MSVKKVEDKVYKVELTGNECATIFATLMVQGPKLPEPNRSECLALAIKFLTGVDENNVYKKRIIYYC